jgi:hypothetical protein
MRKRREAAECIWCSGATTIEDMKTPPPEGHNEASMSSALIDFSLKSGSTVNSNLLAKRGIDEIYPTSAPSDAVAILKIAEFFSNQLRSSGPGSADSGP